MLRRFRPGTGDKSPLTIAGDQRGVLCLHGFTGTPFEIRPLAEALGRAGCTVEAPMTAGHGGTLADLAGTRWTDWLASAEAAMERVSAHVGGGPIAICGFSMGGLLALRLARLHPERVSALVLMGVPVRLRRFQVFGIRTFSRLPLDFRKLPGVCVPKLAGSDVSDDEMRWANPGLKAFPLAALGELLDLMAVVRDDLPAVRARRRGRLPHPSRRLDARGRRARGSRSEVNDGSLAALPARDLILAIDQGTTGSTVLVVDAGRIARGRGYRELPQIYPRPGEVEHDPEAIWESVMGAMADALANVDRKRIAALGITNQRETTVLWERADGRPVGNAIVWQDRRTAPQCAQLKAAGHERRVRERTGLVLDPYFSATKLRWLLDNVGGLRARAESGAIAFGTVDSFLIWRLTGGKSHVSDVSNASRTLLFDIVDRAFSRELCDLFGVPMAMLPEARPSAGLLGETRGVPGLPDGIPITGVAGDQQAALYGQDCTDPGDAKCTFGTGAFLLRRWRARCPTRGASRSCPR